jgi:uncharacterized protein (TIGR02391 family)
MRQAFSPNKGGPLADTDAENGEQTATMDLFAGAIGTFKNPNSHRQVTYDDPDEAVEAVLLSDLLHRISDRIEGRTGSAEDGRRRRGHRREWSRPASS